MNERIIFYNYLECESVCKECSRIANNCTLCDTQYKFVMIGTNFGSCERICDANCKKCSMERFCEACLNENYYLYKVNDSEQICKEKIKISFSIDLIKNPRIFQLSFSDIWEEFFNDISKKIIFSISGVSQNDYGCEISNKIMTPTNFTIICNYKTNISLGSILKLKFSDYPLNNERASHYLDNDRAEIRLDKYVYCGEGLAWKDGK